MTLELMHLCMLKGYKKRCYSGNGLTVEEFIKLTEKNIVVNKT